MKSSISQSLTMRTATIALLLVVGSFASHSRAAIIVQSVEWSAEAYAYGESYSSGSVSVSDQIDGFLSSLTFSDSVNVDTSGLSGVGYGSASFSSALLPGGVSHFNLSVYADGYGADTSAGSFSGSGGGDATAIVKLTVLGSTTFNFATGGPSLGAMNIDLRGPGNVYTPYYWEEDYPTLDAGVYRVSINTTGFGYGNDWMSESYPGSATLQFSDVSISFIPEVPAPFLTGMFFIIAGGILVARRLGNVS